MNKHRIYVILVTVFILSLVLVSAVAAAPPKLQTPRLLYPKNDANLTMANPCQQLVFNWSKVRNIDHYALSIEYLNVDTWIPIYFEWTYTNSNVTWPLGLSEAYQYRWNVSAVAYPNLISASRTVNNFTVTINNNVC